MKVQGHRGARAILPENTLEAFAYAVRVGVDAIELDLTVTRDGKLVVSHDPVREGAGLPTLDDVFPLVEPSRVELNLEVKSYPGDPPPEELARLVLEPIRKYRMEPRVMVESSDLRVVQAMKQLAPEIRRGALTETDSDFLSIAKDVHFVAPHYSFITPEKVRDAHAAGLQVIAWTVNSPDDWARMAAAQVDAIITDDPAALIAWLQARELTRLAHAAASGLS